MEVAIEPETQDLMRRVKEGTASENELSQLRELLGSTPGLAQALQTVPTTTAPLSPQLRGSNDKCKTEASVQISKYYLDFGTKDKKCALNKPIADKIKITNSGNSAVKLKFPESQSKPHIYQLTVTPNEIKLKKGASVEVTVEITLSCTTRLKEIITMQVQGGQNQVFSLRADSVMSQILDYSELNLGSVVGSGGFGTVYKATWRGLPVAVKKMEEADGFDQEVEVHRELAHHPNVVHFVGVCLFPKVTVCEYIEGGSLDKYLNTTPKLAMRIRLKIALEIAKGMMFLHENELLHLDLKPPNFLVVSLSLSAPVAIKLADFGLSQGSSQTFKGRRVEGSFLYMAPEVFLNAQFSRAADVWSYGACLIEIITDNKPFHEYEKLPYLEMVKKRNDSEVPQVPASCNPDLAELITSCLSVDRTKRPTFEQIVQILENFIEQNQAYLGESDSPRPTYPTRAPPIISITSLLSQDILNTPVPSPPTPRSGAVSPRTSPSSSAPSSPFGTPPTPQTLNSGPPPLPPRNPSMLAMSSSPNFSTHSTTPPPVPVRTTPPMYAISSSPSHSSAPPVPPRSISSRSIRIPTSPQNHNVHNPFATGSPAPASPSFHNNNTPASPSRPMQAKPSSSSSELPISPVPIARTRNGLARSASPGSSSFISSSPIHSLASSPAVPLSTSSPSVPHHPLRKHATTTAIIPQTRDDPVDPKSYNPLVKGTSALVRTMTEPQIKVPTAQPAEQLDATGLASAEMDDPKIESLRHLTQTNFDAAASTLEQASRALQVVYSLKPAIEFSKQILAFKRALESASETFLSTNADAIKEFLEINPRPTALQFIYSPPPSSQFSSAESFSHVSALLAKTSIVLGQGLDLLHYCQIRLSKPANVAEILTLAKCARWIKNNAPPLGLNAEESRARAVRERSPTVDSSFTPMGSRFI